MPEESDLPLVLSFKEDELEKLDVMWQRRLQLCWFPISSTGFLCHSWCLAGKRSFRSFGPSELWNHRNFPTGTFSLGDFSPVFAKILCVKKLSLRQATKKRTRRLCSKTYLLTSMYFADRNIKIKVFLKLRAQSRTLILLQLWHSLYFFRNELMDYCIRKRRSCGSALVLLVASVSSAVFLALPVKCHCSTGMAGILLTSLWPVLLLP